MGSRVSRMLDKQVVVMLSPSLVMLSSTLVILTPQQRGKDLALRIQGRLREASRSALRRAPPARND